MSLDFREFRGRFQPVLTQGRLVLAHSAKGSSWEDHKYIKRINGTYYYPNNYEGGRHIDSAPKDKDTKVFDEFESYAKELMKKGEAYWDPDEVSKMSKEELGELYRDLTGVELGSKDLDRLFNSREARSGNNENDTSKVNLDSDDVEKLANEVIRGNFGNGQTRKDLLGENYEEVQKRVNELVKKSSIGSKEVTGKEPKNDKVVKALEKIGSMGYNVTDIAEKYKKK